MEEFECIMQGHPLKEIHGLVESRFVDGVENNVVNYKTNLLHQKCLICGREWNQLLNKNTGYNMDEPWLRCKPLFTELREA